MSTALPILQSSPAKPHDLQLDPRTYARGLSCVHCGLCLPACPTYAETGNEADSPRGRIQLMLGLADGKIDATAGVKEHLDLCLDCRACETACPSGVVYHELIEETRARFMEKQKLSGQARFMQWMFFNVFVHPTRLKLALLPARIMQKLGLYGFLRKTGIMKLLPSQLRKMEQMLPATGALWPKRLPAQAGQSENVKARVGFFSGCIGSVMFSKVNRQAVELLGAGGANVSCPRGEACCGAIHHHNGDHHTAQDFAKRNIDAYCPATGPQVDFIATNIAGCGAMLREYDVLLRDDKGYCDRAKSFVQKVKDISEVLTTLGLPEMTHAVDAKVTYHDACHLAHAQMITTQPRALLARVPGLKMVHLPESDMCCGAAGTYNLTQPEMATRLAERKLKNIAATGCGTCVTGNVGCAMQIQSEADARGQDLQVLHPVEVLHQAVFGAGKS